MKFTTRKKYQNAIVLSLLAVLLMATAVFAVAGDLDTTFDDDGLVTTAIGSGHDEVRAVAIQSDGMIVVAGSFSNPGYKDFVIARYNEDGSLDTSFDTDGIVSTAFGNEDVAMAVAIQDDGKIIAAGYTSPDGSDAQFALARYATDGSLDASFDTDGKVLTDLGSGYDLAYGIAIQPDDKIIVVGAKHIGINDDDIAVLRYNTDGSLDTSFDTDGIATTSGGDFGMSVAIQTDGKIVVGGTTCCGSSNTDFVLARFNSDGTPDTSFDTDGIVSTNFNGFDRGGHVAIQADGQIVLGGSNDDGFILARYNDDGSLDTSFDTDGKVTTPVGFNGVMAQDIALQQNGKIVLIGHTINGVYDFALARFNVDGSLDTSFSTDGKIITDFGSNQDDLGNSVSIQSDGGIVVAGYRYPDGSNADFALARYLGDTPALVVTTDADNTTTDSLCSLREAMTNANDDAATYPDCSTGIGSDIITFAADYTITLVGSQLPAVTTAITITGNGETNTIIEANEVSNTATYRVLEVGSAGDLTLNNLTVRHGRCTGLCAEFQSAGGGLLNQGVALIVSNVTFDGNSASSGGGLFNSGNFASSMTLTNVTFSDNSATNYGGGLYNIGPGLTLTNATFNANSADYGGGLYNISSSPTLTNVTFSGNSATDYGGGMVIESSSNPTLTNATFSGNSATNYGGGLYNYHTSPTLRNVILWGNTATTGLEIYNLTSTPSISYSIVQGSGGSLGWDTSFGTDDGNNLDVDPSLGTLADNGGSTLTFALLPSSAAINAGTNTGCPATDQRGVIRPQGGHCDIGAFEMLTFNLFLPLILR